MPESLATLAAHFKALQERVANLEAKWSPSIAQVAILVTAVAGLTAWQATAQSSISDLEGKVSKLEEKPVVVTPPPKEETTPPKEELPPPPKEETPPPPLPTACTSTTSNLTTALGALGAGKTVCLADGTYGAVSLTANYGNGTLAAEHPGKVTVGKVTASGSNVTVSGLISGSADCMAGAKNVTFNRMKISGEASAYGNTTTTAGPCSWTGDEIIAPLGSGENDAARCWVSCTQIAYEANLIRGAPENGNHVDAFQAYVPSVARGLRFIGNRIVAGAGAQGFFMKDGNSAGTVGTNVTFSDNLIVNTPPMPPYAGSPMQVYGLVPSAADPFATGYGLVMEHNTIWANQNVALFRDCKGQKYLVKNNVLQGLQWAKENETCNFMAEQVTQTGTVTNPTFRAPTNSPETGDWRLVSGTAGITWDPTTRHYGP